MSENAKYVMFEYYVCDNTPFIFPPWIQHDVFVRAMGREIKDVVSAGFVSFDSKGRPSCYGKSTSLGVQAREIDTKILTRMLYPYAANYYAE